MKEIACSICRHSPCAEGIRTESGTVYYRCPSCGVLFQYLPAFSEKAYDAETYYSSEEKGYLEHEGNYRRIFRDLLSLIRRFKPAGKLLEVGCGIGTLLEEAQKCGWQTEGADLSSWAASFCREKKGLEVFGGKLKDSSFPRNSFDVLLYYHTLEHVPDPLSELSEAAAFLKEDGYLAVGVPNRASLQSRLKKEKWWGLVPEHLFQFTPRSLGNLLRLAGFRSVKISQ